MNERRVYNGVVIARSGPDIGFPDEIMYDVTTVDTRDNFTLRGVRPKRNVSDGAKIIAADVGDVCFIKVDANGVTMQLFEGVPFNPCPEIP